MFEHFGIRDVFTALWKYAKYLLIILVVAELACVGLHYSTAGDAASTGNVTDKENSPVYSSSAAYSIAPTEDGSRYELGESGNMLNTAHYLASTYKDMVNTDYCYQYVYDAVMEAYTPEKFIEVSGIKKLNPQITPDMLNVKVVKNFLRSAVVSDTAVVNIYVETYDQQLTQVMIQAAQKYFTEELPKNLDPAQITYVGEVEQKVQKMTAEIELEESSESAVLDQAAAESTSPSLKKQVVIVGVLVVALYCVVVFFVALFRPTLNRRSDFEEYGVPVIGEIPTGFEH